MADNGMHDAAGCGDIETEVSAPGMAGGVHRVTVQSVLHVPACGDYNFLSVFQWAGMGMTIAFSGRKYGICQDSEGLVIAEMD